MAKSLLVPALTYLQLVKLIKTNKDDKYGRYLVDVFYSLCEQDPAKVMVQGTFLNQELLDNRLAVKW